MAKVILYFYDYPLALAVPEQELFRYSDCNMELDEAQLILKALADGIYPTTGEVLPKESPYNDPSVIRALFTVLGSIRTVKKSKQTDEQKQQGNIDDGKPKNAGLPWTKELKAELASKYHDGSSYSELAIYFERTRGAIISELTKQGLIVSSDV